MTTDMLDHSPKLDGPLYPGLGTGVAKLRKAGDRQKHGRAVLEAIRKLQRAELQGPRRRTVGRSLTSAYPMPGDDDRAYGRAVLKVVRGRLGLSRK